MTDLEFFINLWERTGMKHKKTDENNAFITYEVEITDSFNRDAGVLTYCFEIATGMLAEEPYLNIEMSDIDDKLELASIDEQLHYMGILVDSLKEKM